MRKVSKAVRVGFAAGIGVAARSTKTYWGLRRQGWRQEAPANTIAEMAFGARTITESPTDRHNKKTFILSRIAKYIYQLFAKTISPH